MMFVLTVEQIARVCHEANRAYCFSIGDHSQPTWDMAGPWQRDSAIEGVRGALADTERTPEDCHEEWLALKTAQGWKHGSEKVPERKEHPCMVPYDELPEEQRVKDLLFLAVVDALRDSTFDSKKSAIMAARSEPSKPEDSTEEVGILTADGDVVKGGEIETTVKGGKKKGKKNPK